MNKERRLKLSRIFQLVKKNFVFIEDRGRESWQMPPAGYNGKQMIRDDCDGFCLACRSLLRQANISNRLVYCEREELGKSYGHLVVEVDGWILDNMQNKVLPNSAIVGYRWLRISGFEPGDSWREIVNYPA